jgi:phosphatidylglycerophosphate synthase
MAVAGVAFAAMPYSRWAVVIVVLSLLANWFGDSLDGTLARVRGHQRPRYGYYVDHIIDIAGTTFLLLGLGISEVMTPLIALGVLAAYLLVCAEAYLATHAAGLFRMSFLGFGPTELRILLAIGALKAASSPLVSLAGSPPVLLFDLGGVIAIGGLAIAFIASAVRNTRTLYAEEPLPSSKKSTPV